MVTNIKLRLWSIRFYSRSFYSLQLPLRTKWRESFANTTLAFFSYTRHLVKTVAFNHKRFPFTIIAHETFQFFASTFHTCFYYSLRSAIYSSYSSFLKKIHQFISSLEKTQIQQKKLNFHILVQNFLFLIVYSTLRLSTVSLMHFSNR